MKSGNTLDYMKNLRNTKINDPEINKNLPRRNKYILENILLNIFKFCILKYIIKFLQSHDNNNKKMFGVYNFEEHQLRTSGIKHKLFRDIALITKSFVALRLGLSCKNCSKEIRIWGIGKSV